MLLLTIFAVLLVVYLAVQIFGKSASHRLAQDRALVGPLRRGPPRR